MPSHHFTALMDTLPQAILLVAANRQVEAANAAARALLGDHVVGRHFTSALRRPALVDAVDRALADARPGRALFRSQEAGRDVTYDVTVQPSDGAALLVFEDRTAAAEVDQLRRDFVANVSHELRTPLTALFGFIETLRGPARDDAAARDRFLGIMEREASRMVRMVDDLLSLSRVEEDERVRPRDPVRLADVVRATMSDLQPVIAASGAKVTLTDDSAAAEIPGDARQLRQVVGNLLENALKYGGEGATIGLHVSALAEEPRLRGTGLRLTIEDDGPGIAAHHLPRLTERFYRVDDHRSREVGGTGLGLAIVKHIVNRHRGRFAVDSTPGQGTRVTVTLPAQ